HSICDNFTKQDVLMCENRPLCQETIEKLPQIPHVAILREYRNATEVDRIEPRPRIGSDLFETELPLVEVASKDLLECLGHDRHRIDVAHDFACGSILQECINRRRCEIPSLNLRLCREISRFYRRVSISVNRNRLKHLLERHIAIGDHDRVLHVHHVDEVSAVSGKPLGYSDQGMRAL